MLNIIVPGWPLGGCLQTARPLSSIFGFGQYFEPSFSGLEGLGCIMVRRQTGFIDKQQEECREAPTSWKPPALAFLSSFLPLVDGETKCGSYSAEQGGPLPA